MTHYPLVRCDIITRLAVHKHGDKFPKKKIVLLLPTQQKQSLALALKMYVCIHTYMHIYACTNTYIRTCIYTYACTNTYLPTYIHMHAWIHTYIHSTYIHMHTYIHSYACTNTLPRSKGGLGIIDLVDQSRALLSKLLVRGFTSGQEICIIAWLMFRLLSTLWCPLVEGCKLDIYGIFSSTFSQ